MANGLRPELDLSLPAEVEHWLPGILEAVVPTARHAVVGLAPAQLIDKAPAPLPLVGDDEVLHIQAPFAVLGVLLEVEEERAVGRQDRLEVGRHVAEPAAVLLWADRLETTRRIIFALRGIRRGCDHHVCLRAFEQTRHHSVIAAVAADQQVLSDSPHVAGPSDRRNRRFRDLLFGALFGCRAIAYFGEQHAEFILAEAKRLQIEVYVVQFGQLIAKRVIVPSGQFGQLVVSDQQSALLRHTQVVENNHRNFRQAEFAVFASM